MSGRNIYFTESEMIALIKSASEYNAILSEGEETCELAKQSLENGLGSALYKLYKGRNGEKIYESYAKKVKK